jgi:3-deoxy-D-manno-octulosonic-acid transferase
MIFIYNVGIWLYKIGIAIASLFNKKARLWLNGRKNIFKRLESVINQENNIAWFHCASLGEFEQGRPVLEKFRNDYKNYKILLTFFSPSGFEVRKNYEFADYVFYLPIDTVKNAKRFINIVNPRIALFVKYEFWFNYLKVLNKKEIPIIVFSAIFRKNQHFFKWYGAWFRKALRKINFLTVQNQESLELLKTIDVKNIILSGDTRFDRVFQIREKARKFPIIDIFKQDSILFIAGSTWRLDEEIVCNYINKNSKKIKYIIAPHIVSKVNIAFLQNNIAEKTLRFSELTIENANSSNVLIVDGIGYLSHLYAYANIAYIGGGFGKGIHNILEAATFGMPIVFGPNYQKFQEAKDLINKGAAFSFQNEKEFNEKTENLLTNKQFLSECSVISENYVNDNKGATEKIALQIKNFINNGDGFY